MGDTLGKIGGTVFYLAIFALPLVGALSVLIKVCINQVSKFRHPEEKDEVGFLPILKIGFTVMVIIIGVFLALFIIASILMAFGFFPEIELPQWLFLTFLVLVVPYLACVYGIAYGLPSIVGISGMSSRRMFKVIFPQKDKNKSSEEE